MSLTICDGARLLVLVLILSVSVARFNLLHYSPLPERPRLSLRTINRIQSSMLVRKCISGEKSDILHSNHNYDGRQIKAEWNNEEFGYFNTITKIANAILCSSLASIIYNQQYLSKGRNIILIP